ncbi:MAG: hypothetical protein FWG98_09160 [Candidatus Cloacimonetes bacterium]|nr:hypothetical protein [Candidatus Cloacimonadota bacterium]
MALQIANRRLARIVKRRLAHGSTEASSGTTESQAEIGITERIHPFPTKHQKQDTKKCPLKKKKEVKL